MVHGHSDDTLVATGDGRRFTEGPVRRATRRDGVTKPSVARLRIRELR